MKISILTLALAGAVAAQEAADIVAERAAFQPYGPASSLRAYVEQFADGFGRFSPSHAKKAATVGDGETFSYVGKWAVQEPSVYPGLTGDKGLVATSKAAHHAISAELPNVIDPANEDVVVQYEVKLQNGLECGGAYIKVLTESDAGIQHEEFSDATPYSVMFGPDKCGSTNKVHLILRHKSPLTGEIEEKHLKAAPQPRISKTTNLYTLHLNQADQSYEIFINNVSAKKGSLADDFTPAFTPEKEIEDKEDTKPEDWVDQAKITDPDATKPADWNEDAPLEIPDEDAEMPAGWLEDEPATIPDPDAEMPEEWDEEEDGTWQPPSVPNPACEDAPGCGPWVRPMKSNPAYKGKWYAPLIDNPLYKGIWKARKIANPAYFEDATPLANIGKINAVGFEIWSMQSDITFANVPFKDNIYIGSSLSEAQAFAKATFDQKKPIEDAADAAEKPKDPHTHTAGQHFDFEALKEDPVVYLRSVAMEFFEDLKRDPVAVLKNPGGRGAVLGGITATLIGLLGVLATLLTPAKPKVVKKKSSESATAAKPKGKGKVVEVSTVLPAEPIALPEDNATTVKRTTVKTS